MKINELSDTPEMNPFDMATPEHDLWQAIKRHQGIIAENERKISEASERRDYHIKKLEAYVQALALLKE